MNTFFNIKYFTWIELHFSFAINLIFREPTMAGEHVVFALIGHLDLYTVQKPACLHTFVGVANQQTVDLDLVQHHQFTV